MFCRNQTLSYRSASFLALRHFFVETMIAERGFIPSSDFNGFSKKNSHRKPLKKDTLQAASQASRLALFADLLPELNLPAPRLTTAVIHPD